MEGMLTERTLSVARNTTCDGSYTDNYNKLMTGKTERQIIDGIDQFYQDYKNRNIEIHTAVWLILVQINGGSPDLELWRRKASQ
jgi:hypothetical protein